MNWEQVKIKPILVLFLFSFLLIIFFIIGFFLFQQKVLIVGDGFEFTTIQSAVDQSEPGDIILVTDSLSPYAEPVEIMNKTGISIIGIGKPVLDGSTLPAGSNGISISNSSRIRVKGLTIQEYIFDGFGGGNGIIVENSSDLNLFVKNKLISNGEFGFFAFESSRNLVLSNKTNQNLDGIRIDLSEKDIVIGNESNDNEVFGILISSPNSLTLGNVMERNDTGIDAQDQEIFIANKIIDSTGEDVFEVDGSENILIGNKVIRTIDEDGIKIDGDFNILIGNVAIENGETGLIIDDDTQNNIVIGNRLLNNGEDGLLVDEDTLDHLVMNNKMIGNQRNGIRIADRTFNIMFKRNVVKENTIGIFLRNDLETFDQEIKIINNKIIGNIEEGILFGGAIANTINHNTIHRNGIGIRFTEDEDGTLAQENVISHNSITKNEGDGIMFEESLNNTIEKNHILSNGAVGLFLDVDSTGNQVLNNRAFFNFILDIQDDDNNIFQGNKCGTSFGPVDCPN
ncbi:right-handed parallel beta-helix repeat-containing protein [Bacillus spongiae]|uniref:Right-handed parallel beta-helix repeat-containing protein n=1 Tax=Bacillus spongiae TaxID=2683610 RepID=A0ABU8HH61_9BACI